LFVQKSLARDVAVQGPGAASFVVCTDGLIFEWICPARIHSKTLSMSTSTNHLVSAPHQLLQPHTQNSIEDAAGTNTQPHQATMKALHSFHLVLIPPVIFLHAFLATHAQNASLHASPRPKPPPCTPLPKQMLFMMSVMVFHLVVFIWMFFHGKKRRKKVHAARLVFLPPSWMAWPRLLAHLK
jgi:hypothetical protein